MNAVENPPVVKQEPGGDPACSIRKFVIESFRQNIDEASDEVVKWLHVGEAGASGAIEEVMESIRLARTKLDGISETGAERWTTTLKNVSEAWRRLRATVKNARAEFDRLAADKLEVLIREKTNTRPMFLR